MTRAALLLSAAIAAVAAPAPGAAQFMLQDPSANAAPETPDVPDPLDVFADTPPIVDRPYPAFPAIPNRLGVQASCSMVYSITAQGYPHDACGVCEINAPIPPGVTPPPGLLDRITQDFLDTSRAAVSGWRYAYGEPGLRYATVIEYHVPNRSPDTLPEPPYPEMCVGDLIS